MDYKTMFKENLIDLEVEEGDEIAIFQLVARRLKQLGFVNEDYLHGLLSREECFPTGLITQYLNIALPHADTEYVTKPFVYIVRSKSAVTVRQMGDGTQMAVRDFFFLGITEPKEQVGLLQLFMELFMDVNFVSNYKKECDKTALYQLFAKNI